MIESIRGSIWKSRINSLLGICFVGTCALWAATVIVQASWGVNPVTQAFAQVVERETRLP